MSVLSTSEEQLCPELEQTVIQNISFLQKHKLLNITSVSLEAASEQDGEGLGGQIQSLGN